MIKLGNTARKLREAKGLTQKAAAEALEISQVHLSNIENNKSYPSKEILDKYQRLWGVDLYILAWCLHGNPDDLPEQVRAPMIALTAAWRAEFGGLLPQS